MELGWLFIIVAVIFVFALVFLIIWAFSNPGCPVTIEDLRWKNAEAHRELTRATLHDETIESIYNKVLKERNESLKKTPHTLKNEMNDICKIDLDMYLEMLKAMKNGDDDKLKQLKLLWMKRVNPKAIRISSETNIDASKIMNLFNEQLDTCLNYAKEMLNKNKDKIILNPTVTFGKVESITITEPEKEPELKDRNIISF